MIFWISKIHEDGKTRVGTDGNWVKEYGSKSTFTRYFARKLPPGRYQIEVNYDAARKYCKADIEYIYTVEAPMEFDDGNGHNGIQGGEVRNPVEQSVSH